MTCITLHFAILTVQHISSLAINLQQQKEHANPAEKRLRPFSLLLRDQALFKSERGRGVGENAFDAKKFPDPNLIAFMFFGFDSFQKLGTPSSNIIPNYGKRKFLTFSKTTPPTLL